MYACIHVLSICVPVFVISEILFACLPSERNASNPTLSFTLLLSTGDGHESQGGYSDIFTHM